MLGDVAVAVHPDDGRYKHLHGKSLIHPFTDRRLVVVTDAELVDMEFGTGAVKITPAHDPNDFQCGKRHNLEQINVFTESGKINKNGGKFAGLMRYDARWAIEEELTKLVSKHCCCRCRGSTV
ncbi:vas2 [Symbiodinium sp. KB8]|nr:vas2 [Symbiodinium sp. KB8]